MALNQWIGIGRLVATPELKTTQNGISVCGIRIAVPRPYRKDSERESDFFNVTAWRHTAEFICKYFDKGDPIQIIGSLQTRSYTNADGKDVYVTEIVANDASFVEGSKREKSEPTTDTGFEPSGFMPMPPTDLGDDDLPF